MGDRTTFQAYVYACPEDQREAALAVLVDEYGLGLEWGAGRHDGTLSLTEAYTEEEISCGTAGEIAGKLIDAAPGCSFMLWEDPKYQWLGEVVAYTPELGRFAAECGADGQPVMNRSQIAGLISEATADVGASAGGTMLRKITEALSAATGHAWFEDWEADRG